jgi:hypothetical protein
MWISQKVFDWIESKERDAGTNAETLRETISLLRESNAAISADRDATKLELAHAQINFDWLRARVNSLEVERAQLIDKAYGLHLPVPEIVRAPVNPIDFNMALFNDMGDDEAKAQGLEIYGN